jgi:hypothetical protein
MQAIYGGVERATHVHEYSSSSAHISLHISSHVCGWLDTSHKVKVTPLPARPVIFLRGFRGLLCNGVLGILGGSDPAILQLGMSSLPVVRSMGCRVRVPCSLVRTDFGHGVLAKDGWGHAICRSFARMLVSDHLRYTHIMCRISRDLGDRNYLGQKPLLP